MIDSSSQWLMQIIQDNRSGNNIWCCDENLLDQIPHTAANKPRFISNRWDVAQQALNLGFVTDFSDFDLSAIEDQSIDHFFYRISKEKAVTHHLINQALRVLKHQGTLWLCGQKNEGVKTYIEKACALLGCAKNIHKDGANYFSAITKGTASTELLEDDNYAQMRTCMSLDGHSLYSKPGQFGWNKIDQGSHFLIAEINPLYASSSNTINSCLDLGCGYGFLTIASRHFPIGQRVLTDNNAAALSSARRNCEHFAIAAEVLASDGGQQLTSQFELILCNPPFHQGFSVDGDLTDKFLRSSKRLLATQGAAYFVVNQFIPLEKKALSHFKNVQTIAQNKSFKIVRLSHS